MPFWDSLISIAPSIIGAASSLAGNNAINNANKDAAAAVGAGYRQADEILQPAYDDVLGYDLASLEGEGQIWDQQLGALAPFWSGLTSDYATGARGAATRFADQMTAADAEMRGGLLHGAGVYQDELDPAYASAMGRLDPYSEGGAEALGALRGVIARSPDELTPSQMRQREKSIRDMRANQAASGLRGAGRAGVAAFNEGVADLDANFFDINQRRIDDATHRLNTTGYNATGQQVGLDTDRGAKVGASWRDAITGAGRSGSDTRRAIGDQYLRSDDAVLQADMRYGDKVGGMVEDYYSDARRRTASEADARASARMGKANSGAAAAAGPSFADARAGLASGSTRADTYGALGSFIASGINTLKPKNP